VSKRRRKHVGSNDNSTLKLVVLLCFLGFVMVIYFGNKEYKKTPFNDMGGVTAAAVVEPVRGDFYTRLSNNDYVNVVIIGDSIGAGSGAKADKKWFVSFQKTLEEKYGTTVMIDNRSIGGDTSFGQFIKYKQYHQNSDTVYDLAVIVLGQNDQGSYDVANFSTLYESIVRKLKEENPAIEIVTVTESSLSKNEVKFSGTIEEISKHYDLLNVDIRKGFAASGILYDKLAPDQVHPNDIGQQIYTEQLMEVINQNKNRRLSTETLPTPLNENSEAASNIQVVDIQADGVIDQNVGFERNGSKLISSKKGSFLVGSFYGSYLGLSLDGGLDGGVLEVYVDDRLISEVQTYLYVDYAQSYNFITSELNPGKHKIKLVVSNKKHKDSKSTVIRLNGLIYNTSK
jgi:lysophospholipase L1-like esterase